MASGTTPKVRLVRCPKCRMLLQEVEAFPVYKCGGCDTILAAKNQKAIVESTSLLQETKAALAHKLVRVSEHGESSSSTPQEVLPSAPEDHLAQESDSWSGKPDENLLTEGQRNDQNASSDAHHSNCDKLDENGSNEGQQNGSGRFQLESLENCNVQQPGESIAGFLSTEVHHEKEELKLVADANLEAEANDKTSQLEGAYSELATNKKIDSNIEGSSIDNNPLAAREINLTATTSVAAGEVISSDNLEQPQKSEHQGFDRARSTDSFESADFVSPHSELSGPDLEYFLKSIDTRTSHAYDGSISSYDGMDDHFPDHQIHSFKNNFKAANYLVSEEWHRTNKLPANDKMNGNSGMHDHARNLSSDLSNKKHYATAKDGKWHRGEGLEEPVMHRRLHRKGPRIESDEHPSDQIPVSQRASLHGYENVGPSHSAFNPLEKAEYSEQENMKLLRMVYELQEQISKTCHLNGKPNGRTSIDVPWRQKQFPTYYHQEPPEKGNCYPRHHGGRGHRSSWSSHQSRFSRIPYSGGALKTRYEIDNSCLCRHSQALPHSEGLPPPIFRRSRGFCRAHPAHSCYNSYTSCPSSPQRYLESDFSIRHHGIKSDDQKHKDHELRRYLRERSYSVRRHRRPTAGGAPFVNCYHCCRTLELPADFLLLKRRFHQLRCGACLKVLTFSLQNRTHLVPYRLDAA